MENSTHLIISSSFKNKGVIPKRNSGLGENYSPEIKIKNISPDAVSIAVTLDDLDIAFIGTFNHWLIWNLPVLNTIPENIPCGSVVPQLGNAQQGLGFGKHMYAGPKPPFFIKKPHRYELHVYVLDCRLKLSSNTKKDKLISAMAGHILQEANIIGIFGSNLVK